jgi:hypothetical protein
VLKYLLIRLYITPWLIDKHNTATDHTSEVIGLLKYTNKKRESKPMLKMKKNGTQALCLGALVIMATLLVSSEGQRYPGLSTYPVYSIH